MRRQCDIHHACPPPHVRPCHRQPPTRSQRRNRMQRMMCPRGTLRCMGSDGELTSRCGVGWEEGRGGCRGEDDAGAVMVVEGGGVWYSYIVSSSHCILPPHPPQEQEQSESFRCEAEAKEEESR